MAFITFFKSKMAEEAAKSFEDSAKEIKSSGPAEIVCDGPCHRILPKDKFLAKDVETYLNPLNPLAIWCATCQSLCVQAQCNGPCGMNKARAQYSASEWKWSKTGEAVCKVCDGEEDPDLNEDDYDFC